MFNNPLINEEAKQKIAEREQEAETYRLDRQLGYSNRRIARWVLVFIILVIAIILTTVLL